MKKLSIAVLALAAVVAPAQIKQTWSNSVLDANLTSQTLQTAVSQTGSTYTLAAMQDGTGRITAYDGLGGSMWTVTLPGITNNDGARLLIDAEGNVTVSYARTSSNCWLTKFDGATGASLWSKQVQGVMRTVDTAFDGQDNIVILAHAALPGGGYGPMIKKYSSVGGLLTTYGSELASYETINLAVAANGQIYFTGCKFDPTGAKEAVVAITPNGTLRYQKTWTNPGGSFTKPVVAADRNGRVAVVDIDLTHINTYNIRSFDSAGVETVTQDESASGGLINLAVKFDANGRLVVGSTANSNTGPFFTVAHYEMTGGEAENINRANVYSGNGLSYTITDMVTDAFGQTYVCAPEYAAGKSVAQVYAFDENNVDPIWKFKQSFDPVSGYLFRTAVGRWGQVALSATIGTNHSYEGVSGIKQLGLRNLLINGQSFTGGRTVTGTVNFYSNAAMDRAVSLTSSTNYATISPNTTVAAGASQAGMSIELKPTAVRRAVRIEGTFNGAKRSVVFYIEPPVASGLTLFPTSIKGGLKVNGTARINGAAPTGGMAVTLSSNEPAAVVPASVSIAEGAVTKAFQVNTTAVSQTKTATITATTGATSKTATLTVTP